jgi:hypothetical protein
MRGVFAQPVSFTNHTRLTFDVKGFDALCVRIQDALEEPSFEGQQKVVQLVVHRSVHECGGRSTMPLSTFYQRDTAEVWP